MSMDPKDFASSFKGFMETMSAQSGTEVPPFLKELSEHFGKSPARFPVITEDFPKYEHANLHLALKDISEQSDCQARILGFLSEMSSFHTPTLAELLSPMSHGRQSAKIGPVQYSNISLEPGKSIACIGLGLYLFTCGERKIAALIRPSGYASMNDSMHLDVMAPETSEAEKFLADIQASIRKKNVYRNHVLSIQQGDRHRSGLQIKFHSLPTVKREDIILPEGLLNRIERNTIGFGRFSKELLEAGRHLKRGLLFYGPPGTGKTLSAMYLASVMPERTILLLTGRSLGLLQQSCALARSLQPAMIVLEDVDLIAEERTSQQGCTTPLLFELLNEMDGLSDDVDVIFLLTTNRAEILEPALAARPGRIDQAFEVPLPDAACRRRLFDLYSVGLTMQMENVEPFITRTEGASASFMCELLRKSALFAAEDGLPIVVKDKHVDEALRELVISGGAVTRSLLGFKEQSDKAG